MSSIDSVRVRAAASSIAERQPIERAAQVVDGCRPPQVRFAAVRGGPAAEELDRVRMLERPELEDHLTLHTERNLARAQNVDPRAGVEQADGELGGVVDDVLAVVEDDQGVAVPEPLEERRLAGHAQRGDHRVGRPRSPSSPSRVSPTRRPRVGTTVRAAAIASAVFPTPPDR